MLKFAVVAAVAIVASVALSAQQPPVLHSVRSKLGAEKLIQVQRCANTGCTSGCETIVEFPADKCHNDMRLFERGEIMRVRERSHEGQCIRENMYEDHDAQPCKGKLIQSAIRKIGECSQDIFPPGRFSKFSLINGTLTVQRDCDFGCGNCGVMFPVPEKQCIRPPFSKFTGIGFENGGQFKCGGEGWTDIVGEHFFAPTCDGDPNFRDTVFADECYVMFGHGHKFHVA